MNKIALISLCLIAGWSSQANARVNCTNTWHTGTLVIFSSNELPPLVSLFFLPPGQGSNPQSCQTPGACSEVPCSAGPEGLSCELAPIGSCVSYLVSQCTGGSPVIRLIEYDSAGACPTP